MNYSKSILTFFLGLLLSIYLGVVWIHTVNIPFFDEYGTGLGWLVEFLDQPSILDKLKMFGAQANEHRLFSNSLLIAIFYFLTGTYDAVALVLLGALLAIPFFLLVRSLLGTKKWDFWVLAPAGLLLFVPTWETHDWALVSMTLYSLYMLLISSLILLTRGGSTNFFIAALLSVAATFTFGNGMLVFVSGFLVMWLSGRYKASYYLWWGMAMVLTIVFFFKGYRFNENGSTTEHLFGNLIDTAQFFFIFLGSIFTSIIKGDLIVLTLSGVLIITFLIYLVLFQWKVVKNHAVVSGVILFYLGTAGIAAFSRTWMGLIVATSNRYMIHHALFFFMILILMASLPVWKSKMFKVVLFLSVLGLYAVRLDDNLLMMDNHQRNLKSGLLTYYLGGKSTETNPHYLINELKERVILQAVEKGIYKLPAKESLIPDMNKLSWEVPEDPGNGILYNIDYFREDSLSVEINGWCFSIAANDENPTAVLVLKKEELVEVFALDQVIRPDVMAVFKAKYPHLVERSGIQFKLLKPFCDLPSGKWQVGIGQGHHGKVTDVVFSDYQIGL